MMLIVLEGGKWISTNFQDSTFNNNKNFGVHLFGQAQPVGVSPEVFLAMEFDRCEFKDNGKNPAGSFPQGHGFFSNLSGVRVNLVSRRSVFSGNGTCGLRMDFQAFMFNRVHTLGLSNCIFSGNLGKNTQDAADGRDIDPITIIAPDANTSVQIQMGQLTVSDNLAPYAVSLGSQDPMAPNDNLWNGVSEATNCILDGNGLDLGSGTLDVAFYPLPSDPLWTRITDTTTYSVLGDQGLAGSDQDLYEGLVASKVDIIDPGNNLMLGPWQDLGLVFPVQAQLIDSGLIVTHPSDIYDVRGEDREVPLGKKDLGAFEKQTGE